MRFPTALLLLLCLKTAWSTNCGEDGNFQRVYPWDHLPEPVCPVDIAAKYYLYTYQHEPMELNRTSIPSQFRPDAMTIFVVHGYLASTDKPWMTQMKDVLLNKNKNANVVLVDWRNGCSGWYKPAASNTRAAGYDLGKIMANVQQRFPLSQIHCIGHSLGSHVCGHAGRVAKIGRISGLDPAGPCFRHSTRAGLNRTSADFVDVIHTDGTGKVFNYGTLQRLGHVDFYPNKGEHQPGCLKRPPAYPDDNLRKQKFECPHWHPSESENTARDLYILLSASCSHRRAHQYYIESISHGGFKSESRCNNTNDIDGSCGHQCNDTDCPAMGYNAGDGQPKQGLFYLKTNDESPFSSGASRQGGLGGVSGIFRLLRDRFFAFYFKMVQYISGV